MQLSPPQIDVKHRQNVSCREKMFTKTWSHNLNLWKRDFHLFSFLNCWIVAFKEIQCIEIEIIYFPLQLKFNAASPKNMNDKLSFIFCSVYLLLGMALIAMCFNLMQVCVFIHMVIFEIGIYFLSILYHHTGASCS